MDVKVDKEMGVEYMIALLDFINVVDQEVHMQVKEEIQ